MSEEHKIKAEKLLYTMKLIIIKNYLNEAAYLALVFYFSMLYESLKFTLIAFKFFI
jgi:hypothetical protein